MTNPLILRPHGLDAIRKAFGDPRPLMREDGSVNPSWEKRMVAVPLPSPLPLSWDLKIKATTIRVHEHAAPFLAMAFAKLQYRGLDSELKTLGGGYTWRAKRTSDKLSAHSWGIGVDFNTAENPQGKKKKPTWSPQFIAIMEEFGWYSGHNFDDPMHFQFCTGY